MKKWMILLVLSLSALALSACSETGATSASSDGTSGEVAMVDYDQILEVTESYFSDYGNIELDLLDGREVETNTLVATYTYNSQDQKQKVMDFLAGKRVGTLTPEYKGESGKIAVIGWDKREWHYIEGDVSYGAPIDITLVNGIDIDTNDTVSVYEFRNQKEKEELLKKIQEMNKQAQSK